MATTRFVLIAVLAFMWATTCGCDGGAATPREAVERMLEAGRANDYGQVWDLLSTPSHIRAEAALEHMQLSLHGDDEEALAIFGQTARRVSAMNGRQRFIALMKKGTGQHRLAADAAALDGSVIGEAQLDGDSAIVPVEVNGETRMVHLVKQNAEWRIDGTMMCGASPSGSYLLPLLALLPLLLILRRSRGMTT